MKRIMRGSIAIVICALMGIGSAGNAFAVVVPQSYDTDEYTVYVKNNMTFGGDSEPSVVGGNVVVDNVVTGLSWNVIRVTGGLLYPGSAPEYDEGNQEYINNVDSREFLARGPYAGIYQGGTPDESISLPAFPNLLNKGALPENQTVDITGSGAYSSFNVTTSGDTNVSITTTSEDQVIAIKTNTLNIQKPLQIVGPGKVVFYVEKVVTGGTAELNQGGDPRNVMIYLSGNHDATFQNIGGSFNIFVGGSNVNQKTTFSGTNVIIKGNVYTNGNVDILSRQIVGFVYAPNSDITLTGGEAIVRGKLVCKNLEIGSSGKVISGEYYGLSEGVIYYSEPNQTYHVITTASMGGSITQYDTDVEEGTVINVVATADSGYHFVRFEGNQPDESGNITVTADITIRAIFEPNTGPVGYVNGLLGEYFDSYQIINETAIRVKRLDSQIAFNFGYEAPANTGGQIEAESFAERWTGYIQVPVTGEYVFKTLSDDGVILNINGNTLIERWNLVNLDYTTSDPIYLEAGYMYSFTLAHQQLPLHSAIFLFWEADNVPMSLVPSSAFYVTQETYDDYQFPVFLNELSRTGTGLYQEFFDGNNGLSSGNAVIELIDDVNYEWMDSSPAPALLGDTFSAKMTGYIEGKFTGEMTLECIIDDGIRVWVDGIKIIDSWQANSDVIVNGTFNMVRGQKHQIAIDYNDIGGGATCIMRWYSPSQELQVVPIQYLYSE